RGRRGGPPSPRDERWRKPDQAQDRCQPAFHRAAAALLGSLAGQAHGGARHRPALDLRIDPAGVQGPRRCAHRERRTGAPGERGRRTACRKSFSAGYVESDSTAGLEEQLDRISNNEMAWRDLLRDFWREFTAAVGDIKELRVAQVIDALDEMLAPHLFPPRADGADPRKCPNCETG